MCVCACVCAEESERQRRQDGRGAVGGRVIISVTEYCQCWLCESEVGGVSRRMDDMQDVQKRLTTGHVSQTVCVCAGLHTPSQPQV